MEFVELHDKRIYDLQAKHERLLKDRENANAEAQKAWEKVAAAKVRPRTRSWSSSKSVNNMRLILLVKLQSLTT